MADNRRSRWIAWDSNFYDSTVGVMLRDRFGTAGLTLFSAFLCACKRNPVQGQFEYGSTQDALAQMGLPGLELVNERGEAFDLQSLWRALAAHKQCSTRARGRLTQVKSSNWTKWQEGYGSQQEAERKRRSRATNTPDVPPPIHRRSTADKPPDLDLDLDIDPDNDRDKPSAPAKTAERTEAERIVREWWEEKNPKPVAKFIGVVKLVERFLEAGHFPAAVAQALHESPTPTLGALEFQLNKPGRSQPQTAGQAALAEYRRLRDASA